MMMFHKFFHSNSLSSLVNRGGGFHSSTNTTIKEVRRRIASSTVTRHGLAATGQKEPITVTEQLSREEEGTRRKGGDDNHDHRNVENPLLKLKSVAEKFNLCDNNGFRKEDCHWTFALSIVDASPLPNNMVYAPEQHEYHHHHAGSKKTNTLSKDEILKKAPILRTVNFQRVSEKGIDFVMKNKGYASDLLFLKDQQISFLYTIGQYVPGQTTQQWRSQGICEPIRLKEIIGHVPTFTIVEMVASVRANKEGDSRSDMDLSHFTELVQQTREELNKGEVSMMELEEAVRAWRFVPFQMEQMVGGPEQVMWKRHEWIRQQGGGDDDDKDLDWIKPRRLMPF